MLRIRVASLRYGPLASVPCSRLASSVWRLSSVAFIWRFRSSATRFILILNYSTGCAKNPSLLWSIVALSVFGGDTFENMAWSKVYLRNRKLQAHLLKLLCLRNSRKMQTNTHIWNIVCRKIGDNCDMPRLKNCLTQSHRQQKAVSVQKILFSMPSLSKMTNSYFSH